MGDVVSFGLYMERQRLQRRLREIETLDAAVEEAEAEGDNIMSYLISGEVDKPLAVAMHLMGELARLLAANRITVADMVNCVRETAREGRQARQTVDNVGR